MTSGTPTRMAAWLESAWLARYLDRQLEGEELAWFEGYLLDKPELVEAVEVDNALRDVLASNDLMRAARGVPSKIGSSRSAWAAAAASLVLGASLGWWVHGGGAGRASTIVPNPARIVFDTVRGSPTAPVLDEVDPSSRYLLIDSAVPPDARDVTLITADGSRFALIRSTEGFVSFLVDRSVFKGLRLRYEIDGRLVEKELSIGETKGR